jgi:hypothetical protein
MTLTDHPKFEGSERRVLRSEDLVSAVKVFESCKLSAYSQSTLGESDLQNLVPPTFLDMILDNMPLHKPRALGRVPAPPHLHQGYRDRLQSGLSNGMYMILGGKWKAQVQKELAWLKSETRC